MLGVLRFAEKPRFFVCFFSATGSVDGSVMFDVCLAGKFRPLLCSLAEL